MPNGKAIGDARITVTLIMPAMPAMSMPEMKSSFELPWVASRQMYAGMGQADVGNMERTDRGAKRRQRDRFHFHTHLSAR